MTKGICDLRKILHKAQVRLTQAGSLSIGYLRITRRNLLWLGLGWLFSSLRK